MSIQKNKKGEVTFICDATPEAKQVFLAGDFNQWSPSAKRMVKSKDGTFRARLKLTPGQYEYKFVADGNWVTDPNAEEQAPNACGGLNSVVRV